MEKKVSGKHSSMNGMMTMMTMTMIEIMTGMMTKIKTNIR
jgi:hypothetical protein